MRELAVTAFKAIDGAGLARVDFLLSAETGELYLNEINTLPGFTAISMYPKLWEATGIPYDELVERLVALALERHDEKSRSQTSFFGGALTRLTGARSKRWQARPKTQGAGRKATRRAGRRPAAAACVASASLPSLARRSSSRRSLRSRAGGTGSVRKGAPVRIFVMPTRAAFVGFLRAAALVLAAGGCGDGA